MCKPGSLFVVATPIGNLGDISQRSVEVLEEVDLIACEDTRTSGRLLSYLGVATPMTSYHEYNEEDRASELLRKIKDGKKIALISDAGTPLMSDPGYRLVSLCREAGVPVFAVPGPCAGTAALSVSGLPTNRFLFVGFLPKGKAAQAKALDELKHVAVSMIFYIPVNSAPRQLAQIAEKLGDRPAFLVREMTKLYETSLYGLLSEILEQLSETPLKGEITLVVGGGESKNDSPVHEDLDLKAYLYGLIEYQGLSAKEAVRKCVTELNLPRKLVYQASLEVKKSIAGEE